MLRAESVLEGRARQRRKKGSGASCGMRAVGARGSGTEYTLFAQAESNLLK